jgi:hypothetical protein
MTSRTPLGRYVRRRHELGYELGIETGFNEFMCPIRFTRRMPGNGKPDKS